MPSNSVNKVPFNTLLSPEARAMLDTLKEQREELIEQPVSIAAYVEWLITQEVKRQGLTSSSGKKTAAKRSR